MNQKEAFKKIRAELNDFKNLKIIEDHNSILVEGDAYPVQLVFEEFKFLVNLGQGWFSRSSALSIGLEHFFKALSKEYRLIESYRGNFYHKTDLEILKDGKWELFTTTFRPLYPFWRKETQFILQNTLFEKWELNIGS